MDAQIAKILLKEEIDKAKHFVKYCNATGTFPLHKMWKLKKELWPKKAPSLPVAKINHKGRLVSSPNTEKRVKGQIETKEVQTQSIGAYGKCTQNNRVKAC